MPDEKTPEEKQRELEAEQRAADAPDEELTPPDGEEATPPESEERHDQRGMKAYTDPKREAIIKRAKARRQGDLKSDREELDEEGKEIQDAMEAESRGEDPPEPEDPPADPPKEDDPPKEKPVDSSDDLVTIKVDGKPQQVSRSDVEAAGIAALQKERNADEKMRAASKYEESVRNLETSVRGQLEEVNQKLKELAEGTTDSDPKVTPPDEGAVAKEIEEATDRVAEAVYSGDQAEVKEAFANFLASVDKGRTGSTPPQVDVEQVAKDVMDRMRAEADAERQEKERKQQEDEAAEHRSVAERVNKTFNDEFGDLDDRGFRLAQAEFQTLREKRPKDDPVELAREAGKSAQALLNPEPSVEDTLEKRNEAKAATPADPPASERAPSRAEQRQKTRKDVVAQMRRDRGQRA